MDGAVGWHDHIADRFNDGYRRSPAFIERAGIWASVIERFVPRQSVVLDAGCGSGVFSFIAAERAERVHAIDGSDQMIAIARREQQGRGLTNIDFDVAMLDQLSEKPTAAYDAILSSSVLEYVEDMQSVLSNFARLLKPGGKLIISMPNARSRYRKLERLAYRLTGRPKYYRHVHHVLTTEAMTSHLMAAGMALITEPVFFAEPPVPAILRGLLGGSQQRKTLFLLVASVNRATPP